MGRWARLESLELLVDERFVNNILTPAAPPVPGKLVLADMEGGDE